MYPYENPYAPGGYTPFPQYSPPQMPQTPRTNKIYVSGIEGARSFQMAPGTEMLLCDDNQDIVYDVVVDAQGRRTVTALDIRLHEETPAVDFSAFATKADLDKLREELTNAKG